MNKLIKQIDNDIKQAMLSKDQQLVSTLKGLKSAIQYASLAVQGDSEFSEEETIKVLRKESKKRADAIALYQKANELTRAKAEESEKKIIDQYLPEMLDEASINKLVDSAIETVGSLEQKDMGKIIGLVRESSGGLAEGALVAKLVKERLEVR